MTLTEDFGKQKCLNRLKNKTCSKEAEVTLGSKKNRPKLLTFGALRYMEEHIDLY
jgi:hypothetical protein